MIERQDILSDDAIAAPLMLAENLLKAQDAAFKMVAKIIKEQDILDEPLMLAENLLKAQDAAFKMVATLKTLKTDKKNTKP